MKPEDFPIPPEPTEENGSYPAGEEGVLDIGHRHFIRIVNDGKTLLWWHDCHEARAWGWIGMRWWDAKPEYKSGHVIKSLDPLEVEGSLLCHGCQDHGFIRGGRWVPV